MGLCDAGLVEVEHGALEWLARLRLIYQKEARRRARREEEEEEGTMPAASSEVTAV